MLVPWQKNYDKPRQHIKKQRHYFANKDSSSQGYGFSSSPVWMLELDYKESCCYCYVALVLPDPVRPHSRQPTRLPHPWDSPGKNTGVGCHFLLQCMKRESEVAQSCPTLCDPIVGSPPGSPIPGILQARTLEWVAISFSNAGK